jgi:hypothetical protein
MRLHGETFQKTAVSNSFVSHLVTPVQRMPGIKTDEVPCLKMVFALLLKIKLGRP